MTTQISDTQIRNFVHAHVARHQFDAQRMRLRVFNGSVTFSGEAWHLGGKPATHEAIRGLERDVRATTGVHHAAFQFVNWSCVAGAWQAAGASVKEHPVVLRQAVQTQTEPQAASVTAFVEPITMEELLQARVQRP